MQSMIISHQFFLGETHYSEKGSRTHVPTLMNTRTQHYPYKYVQKTEPLDLKIEEVATLLSPKGRLLLKE